MLRIHLLDILRGISVSAMIVYHFFWDLGYFKFIELENITRGLPLLFAQCIGASFIVISGISLRLASYSNNFSAKFLKRLLVLVLICLATVHFMTRKHPLLLCLLQKESINALVVVKGAMP